MSQYQFEQFHFDSHSGVLTHPAKPEQALRHKVAGLLQYLIEHQDKVVSKEQLLDKLWQHGDYRENSLTQSIRELRIALGDNAKQPSFVKTYPQRGYQWICPLNKVQHPGTAIKAPVTDDHSKQATKLPRLKPVHFTIVLCAFLMLGSLVIWLLNHNNSPAAGEQSDSLLVLPFINATGDPAMAWLEQGLSDMLAIDIQRSNQLKVTPPAMANALLLDAELDWPTLPVHIRSLLRDQNLDTALLASVRLHNGQQVFDFKLIHADGRSQQGSISYPSLPAAAQSVTRQLLHLLRPGQARQSMSRPLLKTPKDDPIAAQALAQGMQALQQAGPIEAQKYFKASLMIQNDSAWTRAWLARSRYALGYWSEAEQLLIQIPPTQLQQDPNLDAFVAYWLAELAYRRGDDQLQSRVDIATEKAEQAGDLNQIARSYRLQASIAWNAMAWDQHSRWLKKAHQLFATTNDLMIEADKLFYLGNPSSEGLEKNPQNDLRLNHERLQKALNFYRQLNNQPMIAASQLAIAQNYTLDLPSREQALNQALSLYRKLEQPFELAQTLIYAGFYQVQLHQGKKAAAHFNEAKQIAVQLGSKSLSNNSDFYLAFAMLDQGLDQTALGGHPSNHAKLQQAIDLLEAFLKTETTPYYHASALVFLGWAYTDMQHYEQALHYLAQAKKMNKKLNMQTSFGYSSYSMMRIHLQRQDYKAVIAMADDKITTRLQASFLARAYYENKQVDKAILTLTNFKQQQPNLWQDADEKRLIDYSNSQAGALLQLEAEPKAHLVYCESDWIN